ncbi:MAG: cytochrome c [Halieaceae bacterium]|jgi:cytochrome c553|nr:cytochrome c [Halieaceae bacterium]
MSGISKRYTLSIVGLVAMAALGACQSPGGSDPTATAPEQTPCTKATQASPVPLELQSTVNPLPADSANIAAGRRLYQRDAKPLACVECHGPAGRGDGPIGVYLAPPPTNFACPEVISDTSDGELFWVIREGSNYLGQVTVRSEIKRPGRRPAGTAMRPHRYFLSEEETWQLVLYIRDLQQADEG